jgi:ABC-type sugar transport system ATPase subunit
MISVKDLSISQGNFFLKDISFDIPDTSFVCLMGRTGCGKTTILESVCGLREYQSGFISIKGRDVSLLRPSERNIGYVPQDGALFTTMTVRKHLGFALKLRKWNAEDIEKRVRYLADLLKIDHLLDRKPEGLSGGEIKRVALGRALTFSPGVLCMDEPLNGVDDITKEELYKLFEILKKEVSVTVIYITHNFEEAARLADLILYLDNGVLKKYLIDQIQEIKNIYGIRT